MTGQELFAALSFVDEKYIHEAETAVLNRNTPWMRIVSAAACLCILLVGAFALGNLGHKGAMEEAAAPAAPAATEAAAAPREEIDMSAEEAVPEIVDVTTDELQHISYARLRVEKVLVDGSFEAVAEATQTMEMDTLVTVVVDPSKVPGWDGTDFEPITVAEGDRFEIYDGAYDPGQNILYVTQLLVAEE